jgi:hypothetical protein
MFSKIGRPLEPDEEMDSLEELWLDLGGEGKNG